MVVAIEKSKLWKAQVSYLEPVSCEISVLGKTEAQAREIIFEQLKDMMELEIDAIEVADADPTFVN